MKLTDQIKLVYKIIKTPFSVFEIAGVAGVLTAGSASDLFGRRKTLLVSLIGAPVCLLVFTLTGGLFRIAALLFTGFTLLSTTPVMLALVQEHAGNSPAAANGLFMMISFIARSAVVVVVGFIADRIGLQATYLISEAIGLVGIPFIFRFFFDWTGRFSGRRMGCTFNPKHRFRLPMKLRPPRFQISPQLLAIITG